MITAARIAFFALIMLSTIAIQVNAVNPSLRQWGRVNGDNLIEISAKGIHIDHTASGDTTKYASVRAPLNLPATGAWSLELDARFGVLRSAGSLVRLRSGDETVAWFGADGWYKAMSAFIGPGAPKLSRPADDQWHHFAFRSDGKVLSIWLDGERAATAAIQTVPTAIEAGAWQIDGNPPGKQTELWIRSVHEATGATSPDAVDVPPAPVQAVTRTETVTPAKQQEGLLFKLVGIDQRTGYGILNSPVNTEWFVRYEVENRTHERVHTSLIEADVVYTSGERFPIFPYDPARSYWSGILFMSRWPDMSTDIVEPGTKKIVDVEGSDATIALSEQVRYGYYDAWKSVYGVVFNYHGTSTMVRTR